MKSKGLVVLAVLAILLCFASLAYFIPKIQKTNQVYSLLKTYAIRWFIVDEDLYLPDKTVGIVLTNHNRHHPITVQCIELIFGKSGELGLLWVGNYTLKAKFILASDPYDETIIIVRNLVNPQIFDILWKEKDYLYPSTIKIKVYTTTANYTFAPIGHGVNTSPISIEK